MKTKEEWAEQFDTPVEDGGPALYGDGGSDFIGLAREEVLKLIEQIQTDSWNAAIEAAILGLKDKDTSDFERSVLERYLNMLKKPETCNTPKGEA